MIDSFLRSPSQRTERTLWKSPQCSCPSFRPSTVCNCRLCKLSACNILMLSVSHIKIFLKIVQTRSSLINLVRSQSLSRGKRRQGCRCAVVAIYKRTEPTQDNSFSAQEHQRFSTAGLEVPNHRLVQSVMTEGGVICQTSILESKWLTCNL